ncbi:uncharacterized protein LOC119452352 isoform X2 [Dermacentor silvarum]|uniref:uncharacterized protein LOC119452352 isoform X2 n=1 Tax=Dermacentor silvarum TaxID=543639 RepID=UPI002100F573|nr:uncharacterized protein LOC119452352 isoform X2 [Dermacentor silvarum]
MATIVPVTLGILAVLVAADASCYTPRERNGQCKRDPYRLPTTLFGTKTSYRHATGLDSKWAPRLQVPGCKPLLLMLFMRHTTRYPGKKDLKKFGDKLNELQMMILNASRASSASRFRMMFPGLLPRRFREDEYSVTATSRVRTQDTAIAFLKEVLYRKGGSQLLAQVCILQCKQGRERNRQGQS